MRFLARMQNLIRGLLGQWLGRREQRNPEAVYEAAIQERLEQYAKLRQAEAGQCGDGVNNDVWTGNTLTDCADPACVGDLHCNAPAPAVSRTALVLMFVLLCLSGVAILRRRRS